MSKEKQNASDFPKYYYTRHMQAGLCAYEDETILVDSEAVKKLGNTFKGKPIYIEHQNVKLDTMKQDAVGYVQNTFMDIDGWLWSEIMITDDEAHEVIARGWAVSNAYTPTVWGDGGTKHNIPYDREVLDGVFTHLALVDNPRYEDAKIYTPDQYQARNKQLVNSLANVKPPKKDFIMKFWKKEEVSDASTADFVEYTNDKGATVTKSVEEMKNALEQEAKQKETLSKKVLVNGKEMTVAELTSAYEKLNAKKKNEDEKEEKENEDEDKEKSNKNRKQNEGRDEKENTDDDEYDNEDDKEKENEDDKDEKKNSNFKRMKNAHLQNSGSIRLETTMSKLARGSSLYGSVQK
jgi:hypothetical protein